MIHDKKTTSLINDFVASHAGADDAELARALVGEAGQLAARMRSEGLETDFKTSVSDVVTDADRAAETFVAGVLAA
ncbi:MAG TPA: inositol monophosphatase, partial [Corynebacterium sp.]|nr:inositol monophosphatase [Corynebacterium sp.]